jgi:hypothetical protein
MAIQRKRKFKNKAQNYSKAEFIAALKEIKEKGWIESHRPGNDGGAGNTLEDLLGIDENNLPIADTAEWELKTQKTKENYITMFHLEPSPREANNVVDTLLPKYGWPHKQAGIKYPRNEMSFRATLNGATYTDRGFKVTVDRRNEKVLVTFDSSKVSPRHAEWLERVASLAGRGEINPQPFWSFDALREKTRQKSKNVFFVGVEKRGPRGAEEYFYDSGWTLEGFSFDLFVDAIENGDLLVDFDARTHHNHGTKYRTKDMDVIKTLYKKVEKVF